VCRVLVGQYPAAPASVGHARRWAERTLARWELNRDAVADAVLLTSELVTNAVLHARSPLVLSLAVADGVLEIGVGDEDRRSPRRRTTTRVPDDPGEAPDGWWPWPADVTREDGRGLLLLDELADEWGVANLATGKQVWFRLDAGGSWPYRTACPCAGDNLGQVRLESGRQVLAVNGPWDEPD
jgi:anti-sigma regulatory factor (Ser/Thr protein kinase)